MTKAVVKSKTDMKKKTLPISLKVEGKEINGKKKLSIKNPKNAQKLVQKSSGFNDAFAGNLIIENTLYANTDGTESVEQIKSKSNYILAILADLKPKDGFEGMLISQMITIYDQAMKCFTLAILNKEYPDALIKYQNQGVKLMRVYNQQLEALDKHRRKGNQKMTVEHVHVHEGGQAIVGSVMQGGGVTNEK